MDNEKKNKKDQKEEEKAAQEIFGTSKLFVS
jgi:hypothetical protein